MKELTKNALVVAKDIAVAGVAEFSIGYTLGQGILNGTAHLVAKFPKAAIPIALGGTIAWIAIPVVIGEAAGIRMYPTIEKHMDDLRYSYKHREAKKNVSYKFSIA